jgi:phosphopantothenoylcysteine decarboxylase/phosphopantothenate--cysteine ligase
VMACGEFGSGRLPEPFAVWRQIARLLDFDPGDEPVPMIGEVPEGAGAEEVSESENTGLGGLSGSLISRKVKRALPSDEDELVKFPQELADEGPSTDGPPQPLDMGGPVLAKKGRAKSAPPTDPDAINHLVSGKQTPPEPFLEELTAPNLGANAAELLDGQPDFDLDPEHRPLFGKHILVTAGPTHEPIDPVRYIANRSSGKQGYAIAAAAARAGARVTLVSGPVALPTPPGVDRIDVETAREMAAAVKKALPADAAVMVAAVADWRTSDFYGEKIKKRGSAPPALMLTENPDILASVSAGKHRPALLIGFAAETEAVLENAKDKRKRKGVDWIVANDVSGGSGKSVMGGDANLVHIITSGGVESLPEMSKEAVALALMDRIADAFHK